MIERLKMLTTLINETAPDIEPLGEHPLFHHHSIQTLENIRDIKSYIRGNIKLDEDTQREHLIRIMKESNRYWKIRNLIKEGDVGDLYLLEMEETIMEYLEAGSKINAIKYYREVMQTHFNEKVTLREAKDAIDDYDQNPRKARLW